MLRKTLGKAGKIAAKKPAVLILLAVLITFLSVFAAGYIQFASGEETFVSENTQLYQNFDSFQENFRISNMVLLVETQDIYAPKEIKAVKRFDTLASEIPGVENVLSLADLTSRNGEIPSTRTEIKNMLRAIGPETAGKLIPNDKASIVYIEIEKDVTENGRQKIYRVLDELKSYTEFPPGTELTLTGDPAFGIQMQNAMQKDLRRMLMAAALLVVIALFLFFRNVDFNLLPLIIILIAVIWTFGGMGVFGVNMTMASMAVFPILVGIGIDYAVQFHSRVQEELDNGKILEAVPKAYRNTGPAVLKALFATSLGFIAMMTFPLPMIKDFSFMAIIGLVSAYIAVIILLIPIFILLKKHFPKLPKPSFLNKVLILRKNLKKPFRQRIPFKGLDEFLGKIAVTAARKPVPILVISLLLVSGGFLASKKVDVTVKEENLVPQNMPALVNLNKFHKLGERGQDLPVIVKGDVYSPETLKWMQDFTEYEQKKNPNVKGGASLATVIAQRNNGKIPENTAKVEKIINSLPPELKNRYIEGNTQAVMRFTLSGDLALEQYLTVKENVKKDLEFYKPPPDVSTGVTGGMVLMSSVLNTVKENRTLVNFMAFLLIFLGLAAVYRNWFKALMPVIPIAFVTGWNGAAMFLTGTDYTPMTATLGALTIGVGSEYTILMMERYFEERQKNNPIEAMEIAASKIGRAITVSGLTTVFGFSALMAATFPMIQNFGKVTIITILLALISSFIVLPPLLVNLDKYRNINMVPKK